MLAGLCAGVVGAVVGLLWAALHYIDFILVACAASARCAAWCLPWWRRAAPDAARPKVVIVGASFAGLKAAQAFEAHRGAVDVTVVDCKNYFEYTPGVLRCLVDPGHFRSLSAALPKMGAELVHDEVTAVQPAAAEVGRGAVALRSGRTLPYDYLVLATGSTYHGVPVIKADAKSPGGLTRVGRQQQWDNAAAALEKARTVLIVGAGAVGVELAGEIVTAYPDAKRVVMVDMADGILKDGFFKAATKEYATRWLQQRGVEVHLGGAATVARAGGAHTAVLPDGSTVTADVVYNCFGAAAANAWAKETPFAAAMRADRGGAFAVNDHLQLDGYPTVFAVGDVCFHERTDEEKLAHTAEVNAELAAENVLAMARGAGLARYPEGVVGAAATPEIYDLSLGKYDGSLGFNQLVINGPFAAVIKWLLEYTKVLEVERRPVGVWFWVVLDAVGIFLGRTVLPTRAKCKTV